MVTWEQGRRKFLVCMKEKSLYLCSLLIPVERGLQCNKSRETSSPEQKGSWEESGEAGKEATLCVES